MEEIRNKKEIATKILELEKELVYRYTGSTKELIRAKIDTLKLVLRIRGKEEVTIKIIELEKELGYRYTDSTKELIRAKIDILKWVLCQT